MSNKNPTPNFEQYKLRKIRKIAESNQGDVYGITIPKSIANKFKDCKFTISYDINSILFKSGIDLQELRNNIDNISTEKVLNLFI